MPKLIALIKLYFALENYIIYFKIIAYFKQMCVTSVILMRTDL
uniref:Uncharacterized protein n=1 Tax=Anguilla anguilla TaxID=7936 RepID=A0A0E9W2K1_ANGAN